MIARSKTRRAALEASHLSVLGVAGIFATALLVRLAALIVLRPRVIGDGVGFVAAAQALQQQGSAALGMLPIEHSPLYPILLVPLLVLPWDIGWSVAVAQALVGAATVVIVGRMTARETDSRLAGLCAAAIATVQITFVFWTAYLVSETIFLFVLALTADRALVVPRSSHPGRGAALVALMALLAIAVRPTGAAFALALLLTLIAIAHAKGVSRRRLVVGFLAPFVLLATLSIVATPVGSVQPLLAAEHVADWTHSAVTNGLLETPEGRATSGVDLDVTPPPILAALPPDQRNEFVELGPLTFAAHHPEFIIAQSVLKLGLFWTPVMPEYSVQHALAYGVYFSAFYLLSFAGLLRAWRVTELIVMCLSSVLAFTVTSVVTIVDYDQRYRLPAELFLVPLAGVGLAWLLQRTRAYRGERGVAMEQSRARSVAR